MRRFLILVPLLLSTILSDPASAQTDAGTDFTPGDQVLYVDNFARVPLGMLPRNLKLAGGNAEVAKVGERFVLRVTADPADFSLSLPSILPERFTLEMDMMLPRQLGWDQSIYFVAPTDRNARVIHWDSQAGIEDATVNPARSFLSDVRREGAGDESGDTDTLPPRWDRLQVMGDGNFVKVYVNGTRVANVPDVNLGRSNALYFSIRGTQEHAVLLGNIRVAGGGKDLYRALMEDGQVTLEGIEFDSGSDALRPSSDAALGRVAAALKDKKDLTILVQGHTDDVGDDAANKALSERRAESVIAYLQSRGVARQRMIAVGAGQDYPVAGNDTPEGRQLNRRVEITIVPVQQKSG